MTGVDSSLVKKSDEKASVYQCTLCNHKTKQKAQAFTHICHIHLGTCLLCRLYDYRTYRVVDMCTHLKCVHPHQENEWLEPLPDLSDLISSSSTKETHKNLVANVKEESIVLDDN